MLEASTDSSFATIASSAQFDPDTDVGAIGNLQPSTLYHFRVKAVRPLQSDYSYSVSGTTSIALPGTPQNVSATATSASQIQLSWNAGSGTTSSYLVYRREGSSGDFEAVGYVDQSTAFEDEYLTDGVSYTYYVVARNVSGESSPSSSASATTTLLAPVAPGGLYVFGLGQTSVSLAWGDYSHSETSVIVERKVGNGAWQTLTTLGANATEYVDTTLSAGTDYAYKIKATNAAGASEYSEELPVATPPNAPAAPSGLTATAGSGSIALSWSDASVNEDAFVIERSLDGTQYAEFASVDADVANYNDTDVVAGTRYWYRVKSKNITATSSGSNAADATLQLFAPTNVVASAPNGSEINIRWSDPNTTEAGYAIEMSSDYGETFSPLATTPVNATGWSVTGLSVSTNYVFRVKAIGVADSNYAEDVSAQTKSDDKYWEPLETLNNGTWTVNGVPPPIYYFDYSDFSAAYQYRVAYADGGINLLGSSPDFVAARCSVYLGETYVGSMDSGDFFYGYDELKDMIEAWGGMSVSVGTGPFSEQIGVQLFDNPYGDNSTDTPGTTWVLERAKSTGPTVSVTALDAAANEPPNQSSDTSNGKAIFRISRTGDTTDALTVHLHPFAGTAVNGIDYESIVTSVTIPANQTYVDVILTPSADSLAESTESATLLLKASASHRLDANAQEATATIADGPLIDLKIDSDNDGLITAADDPIEADAGKPGKIIRVNDDDTDGDGVPDWIDGYSRYGGSQADANLVSTAGEQFSSIVLHVPALAASENATVTFQYETSDPIGDTSRTGFGTTTSPYRYPSPSKPLRLWKGTPAQRDASPIDEGGDYVAPNRPYSADDLGLVSGSMSMFVEGIQSSSAVGDQQISVLLDPDGSGPLESIAVDTVRLTVVPRLIAGDGDRDGEVEFNYQDDRNLKIWLNNDSDAYVPNGSTTLLADDLKGGRSLDFADSVIRNSRDLEDMFRVKLLLPTELMGFPSTPALNLSHWTAKLRLNAVSGSPKIRLFPVTTTESEGYLTNAAIASQMTQNPRSQFSLLGSNDEVAISNDAPLFGKFEYGGDQSTLNLLFEGVGAGVATLSFNWYYKGRHMVSDAVTLDIRDIKQFYETWTMSANGLPFGETTLPLSPNSTSYPSTYMRSQRAGNMENESGLSNDYVLLVHGWRMTVPERDSYAETAYKRMYWQGYQGRFGVYSWPTEWVETNYDQQWKTWVAASYDTGNFPRSEEVAYNSGAALSNLLSDLSQKYRSNGGKVTMFAHSMGNMVASEALRQLDLRTTAPVIDTYILTQAAMTADAYRGAPTSVYPASYTGFLGGANPFFSSIDGAASQIVNFYNPDDYALNMWERGNTVKGMRGSIGFGGQSYNVHPQLGPLKWLASGQAVRISFATNPYEMFAYVAESQRVPVGRLAVASEGGPISTDVDLRTLFAIADDHSGQWNTNLPQTRAYWRKLLTQSGITMVP